MMQSDLTTRIIAVLLALFLWSYVRMAQDTPDTVRAIRNVPVTTTGKSPANLTVKIDPRDSTIETLYIRGRADLVNNLTPDEVQAKIDISALTKAQTARLNAMVHLPAGVKLAQRLPKVLVTSTPLMQQTFPVQVTFITSPPPGATVGQYQVQPETVAVEGAEEALKQVKYVTVAVNPDEPLTAERKLIPRAVNAQGDPVKDVQILVASVTVSMMTRTGTQVTRQVAVRPPHLVHVPAGYQVDAVRVRPDTVTLRGDGPLLERQPAYLETGTLDVRGLTQDATRTVRLKVPDGLSVVEGPEVRVDLQVTR